VDTDNKLNNCLKINGIINKIPHTQNFKENKNKITQCTSLPALLYGSENLTTEARDTRRITAAEMKYM